MLPISYGFQHILFNLTLFLLLICYVYVLLKMCQSWNIKID